MFQRRSSGIRLIFLAVLMLSVLTAMASDENGDEIVFNDFTLYIGDSINIGDYRAELIEIQSVRDGLAVLRVSQVGGALDEQRALLQNNANNFEGGAEGGGITLTVVDIFDDQSAKVRVEYKERLGTARKRTSELPRTSVDLPNLVVEKSFDRELLSVGDEVKATVTVKNVGTGTASDIRVEDLPPLPEFSYLAGYPPKIKEKLEPGESDSSVYVMSAIKGGSIRVPAIQISYTDSKKNVKSNSSAPFNVLINPRSKPDLELRLIPSGPIPSDGQGSLNVSIVNVGKASATRVQIQGEIKPSDGLDASSLERTYFEILPGGRESYSAELQGKKAGNYTVSLKASFEGEEGTMLRESSAEVIVLEREYKYQYLLLLLPIIIIAVWMYRRYREYKY